MRRAATVRTVDGKNGQNERRPSLDRLNASMIKQKNNQYIGVASRLNHAIKPMMIGVGG